MSLKEFLKSKAFVKHLALALVAGVGMIFILIIWLNLYTHHGQSRPVPDIRGLTLQDAKHAIHKSRLKLQVIDSVYTSFVPKGCIADQIPMPGHRVKKGRTVTVTINAFNPEMVAVPDLVGLPRRQALAQIETAGLQIGQLAYISDISVDFVLKQKMHGKDIAPGDSVQKGMIIDLVLGKGLSDQHTTLPNLKGLTLERARDQILGASLNLGAYMFDETIKVAADSVIAFVFKQNPAYEPEATAQLGSSVYIWLTVDSLKLGPLSASADSLKADSTTTK
jgi:eukaryotic-like serine/threonine-protein kinase